MITGDSTGTPMIEGSRITPLGNPMQGQMKTGGSHRRWKGDNPNRSKGGRSSVSRHPNNHPGGLKEEVMMGENRGMPATTTVEMAKAVEDREEINTALN